MERTEVIKALECCAKDDCDNCPNGFGNCYSNLAGDALYLIKELTEENKRLDLYERITVVRSSRGNGKTEFLRKLAERKMDSVKADTLRELKTRITREIGTYLSISIIKVEDMFKLIDRIADEIIGGADDKKD